MLVDKNDPSLQWVLNTVRENGLYDAADIITYHALADAINMYKKIKTDMKGAPYSHQEEGSQGQIITKAHPAAKQLFDCMTTVWGSWDYLYSTQHKPSKADVGLSNVPNWSASDSVSTTDSHFATSKAVKAAYDRGTSALNTANSKITKAQGDSYYLGKTAKAASATVADKASFASSYLQGNYISGGHEKPNYFGGGKIRGQMLTSGSNEGGISGWTDALWISSYSGSDVKGSIVY